MIYLRFIGPHLLPDRDSMADLLSDKSRMKFFTEAVIPPESNLIGREVSGVQLFKREGVRLIDVIRGDVSLRRNLKEVTMQVGDRVVSADADDRAAQPATQQGTETRRSGVGGRDHDGRGADHTGLQDGGPQPWSDATAAALRGVSAGCAPAEPEYRAASWTIWWSRLAIPCCWKARPRTFSACRAIWTWWMSRSRRRGRSGAGTRRLRLWHWPGSWCWRRLGVAPILALACMAVAMVLLTRCIDADEAFSFIDGRLLALIFSMLAVGAALETSGAVESDRRSARACVIGASRCAGRSGRSTC